jgi:hypothetical protein
MFLRPTRPFQDALARIEDRDEDEGTMPEGLDETRAAYEVAESKEDDEDDEDEDEDEDEHDEDDEGDEKDEDDDEKDDEGKVEIFEKDEVCSILCVSLSLFAGPWEDEGLF